MSAIFIWHYTKLTKSLGKVNLRSYQYNVISAADGDKRNTRRKPTKLNQFCSDSNRILVFFKNLFIFEHLLKLAVDKFCEKLPSFMSNRILVWIEICLGVGTPLAKQR